jgi:lysozyme family protein
MGVGRASKLLQEAVGVTADGVIGNGTLQAVQKTNPRTILENFSAEKTAFYKSLSTFDTFGKGWLS